MASGALETARSSGIVDLLAALLHAEGSAQHGFLLGHNREGSVEIGRTLADTVHYLSSLYGRSPGLIDTVTARGMHSGISDWLSAAVDGFTRERSYLNRVVVAAGPLPSTPGQAESEAAVTNQRHAIEMLAKSDRAGCALGAAFAKALDWRGIRQLIDTAAIRFGVEPPTLLLPSMDDTLIAAREAATSIGVERAIGFGAQQIFVQHRGLWDLLEAREIARRVG